jgi:uncharacterized membrane protein (UPF0127 family)
MQPTLRLTTATATIDIEHANSWWSRFLGLMGRAALPANRALLLEPCASIHTMWMRFPLDVIFLDKNNRVLQISNDIRPFRFCFAPKGATKVLEMTAGNVNPTGICLDQRLNFASITQ